jgi:hypothetical protein
VLYYEWMSGEMIIMNRETSSEGTRTNHDVNCILLPPSFECNPKNVSVESNWIWINFFLPKLSQVIHTVIIKVVTRLTKWGWDTHGIKRESKEGHQESQGRQRLNKRNSGTRSCLSSKTTGIMTRVLNIQDYSWGLIKTTFDQSWELMSRESIIS